MAFARSSPVRSPQSESAGEPLSTEPLQAAAVKLGRQSRPPIPVPDLLLRVYLPEIGPAATLVWITLRWWVEQDVPAGDIQAELANQTGLTPDTVLDAIELLQRAALLELQGDGIVLHEPSDAFVPLGLSPGPPEDSEEESQPDEEQPGEAAAAVDELPDPPVVDADEMQAVVGMYHRKIGMMGPSQFEKLRFWIDEQGMRGEVVALAIEETVRSAKRPSIAYLEGVLRNWHNGGVRNMQDLLTYEGGSSVLAEQQAGRAATEGRANADAYRQVQTDAIQRWKELYPDEYES